MRGALFICLVFLFLPAVFAEELLESRVVYVTESIDADGVPIKISMSSGSVLVVEDGTAQIIPYNTCKDVVKRKVCVGTYYGNSCDDWEDVTCQIDEGTKQPLPAVEVEIYDITPKITIERTIEPDSVLVGDKVYFTTDLVNEGSLGADNIVFTEAFPNFITVLDTSDGIIKQNEIMYEKTSLRANTDKQLLYTVRPVASGETTLVAEVEYVYEGELFREASFSDKLIVKDVVEASFDTNQTPTANSPFLLTVTLTNNADTDSRVRNFSFIFPPNVDFYTIEGQFDRRVPVEGREFTWDGLIEDEQVFVFEGVGRAGDYAIDYELDYVNTYLREPVIDFYEFEIKQSSTSSSTSQGPLDMRVVTEYGNYLGGFEQRAWVRGMNTGDIEITDISGRLTSDYVDANFALDSLPAQGRIKTFEDILEFSFLPPTVLARLDRTIEIEGEYYVVEGGKRKRYEFDESYKYTLYPFDEAIEVSHEITSRNDNRYSVNVVLSNNLGSTGFSRLEVQTKIPYEVVSDEKTYFSRIAAIDESGSNSAHAFTFNVPFGLNDPEDMITTVWWRNESLTHDTELADFIQSEYDGPTIKIDATDLVIGKNRDVSVELTNKEQTISNVRVRYLPGAAIDVQTNEVITVTQMEPGELFEWDVRVTPTAYGKMDFGRFIITYNDEGQKISSALLDGFDVSVENEFVQESLLVANATIFFDQNDSALITVDVSNLGYESTNGTVFIANKTLSFTLSGSNDDAFSMRVSRQEALEIGEGDISVSYQSGGVVKKTRPQSINQDTAELRSTQETGQEVAEAIEEVQQAYDETVNQRPSAEEKFTFNLWVVGLGALVICIIFFVLYTVRRLR